MKKKNAKIRNVSGTRQRRIRKRARRTKLQDVQKRLDLGAVENLYASGLIDRQVAGACGVSERTLNRYKHDLWVMAVVEKGREKANRRVVKSLFQKAVGYNVAEVTMEPVLAVRQEAGVKGKVMLSEKLSVTKTVVKHVPADQGAIEFWLTNRAKGEYKKRVDVTSEGKPISATTYVVPAFSGKVVRLPVGVGK